MKKILVTMMALALAIAAQAQRDTIGVSRFTAIYRYECKTTDADGQPVTESMYIAVQTSGGITKSFPYEEYDRQKKAARALPTAIWLPRCTWEPSSRTIPKLESQRRRCSIRIAT